LDYWALFSLLILHFLAILLYYKAVSTPNPLTAGDSFSIANAHVRSVGSGFGCMAPDGGDTNPYPMTLIPSSTGNTIAEAEKDLGAVYSSGTR
jgi:hypothetical protein